MTATLSIDFGNSYTKVGIRRDQNATSQALRSERDLKYDEDNICIPTVAARVQRNGKEQWLYGTEVKAATRGAPIRVFRNWKPHFFKGVETRLGDEPISGNGSGDDSSVWAKLTVDQLKMLLGSGKLTPDQAQEVERVLRDEPVEENYDFEAIGRGFFAWLRTFVEPFCQLHGIDTTAAIPARITLPSFGANSAEASLKLGKLLEDTGWKQASVKPTLPEPVANLIGTFTEGRNVVWKPPRHFAQCPNFRAMFEGSRLFKAIRERALSSRSKFYWIMIADLGGYTTDFAMLGFDLDEQEIQTKGRHEGRRLLGDYSEPIGVHDLDKRIRNILSEAHRKAFDSLGADVDGLRLDRFHQQVYQQQFRPYDTGQGIIGRNMDERERIEGEVRRFAEDVAESASRFLLNEQYTHIDELILTGGGCNIPLVREAIRKKLERYELRNSYVPSDGQQPLPGCCTRLDRHLVRGATALGGCSVYFDYD